MTTEIAVSLIMLLIAFFLFIFLCLKNFNPIFVSLLCAILICLVTPDGILSLFTVFLPGVSKQFQNFFLVYTLGGAYGYALMVSGASTAVSNHLIKLFGSKNVPIIIFVISALFMFAGVASYQYAILALSLPLLAAANLPKKVALAAMSAGAGSIAMWLCGSPSTLNIGPSAFLGTTTMAAPLMAIIAAVVAAVFIVLWLNHLVKKARRDNEGFTAHPDDAAVTDQDTKDLPPAWKGYISLLLVFGVSIFLQFVIKLSALQAVVFAQLISIVILFFLVGKSKMPNPVAICMKGFESSIPAVITICMVVGYGSCVQVTSAYQYLIDLVLSLNAHPYVVAYIGVNLLAGLCASGLGGVNIFMQSIGTQLAANPAVNANAFHRIMAIAGSGFDSLPHNGAIAFQLSVFKLRYSEGYFQQFMMSVIVNLLAGAVAVAIGLLLY